MQQSTVDSYKTSLINLSATTATVANLASIQTIISDLETSRNLAISQQSPAESSSYLLLMMQSNILNAIITSAKLIDCYNDYDNVIANEPDIEIKKTLIENKQAFYETLKSSLCSCQFFENIISIIKFIK